MYLQHAPLALVRQSVTIVAIAKVLITGRCVNAKIELMRYRDTAPLIGLERSRRKRLWDHPGIAVARFGGHFYNFEGLREYKNKFGLRWESCYMAA